MNINSKSLFPLTMALCASLSPMDSLAGQNAPPQVAIQDLSFAGSACPPGSVTPIVARNRKALNLAFSSLNAEDGPGVPITRNRQNCNLIVRLSFPRGWSFTFVSADYRGAAHLDPLVQGTVRSAYSFEGGFPSAALETHLVGPIDRNFRVRNTLSLNEAVWSPCGNDRALNINAEVRVSNRSRPQGSGLLDLDTTRLGIKWRRCSADR